MICMCFYLILIVLVIGVDVVYDIGGFWGMLCVKVYGVGFFLLLFVCVNDVEFVLCVILCIGDKDFLNICVVVGYWVMVMVLCVEVIDN